MGVGPALGSLDLPQECTDIWHMYTDAHTWTEFHNIKLLLISFPLLLPESAGYIIGKCLIAFWG